MVLCSDAKGVLPGKAHGQWGTGALGARVSKAPPHRDFVVRGLRADWSLRQVPLALPCTSTGVTEASARAKRRAVSASRTWKHSVQPPRPGAPSRRSHSPPAPAPAAFTVLGGRHLLHCPGPGTAQGPQLPAAPALAGPPPCSPAAPLACPPASRLPQGPFGSMCPVIATDRGALTPEQAAPPPKPTSLFSKGQLGSGAGLLRIPPPGPHSEGRQSPALPQRLVHMGQVPASVYTVRWTDSVSPLYQFLC